MDKPCHIQSKEDNDDSSHALKKKPIAAEDASYGCCSSTKRYKDNGEAKDEPQEVHDQGLPLNSLLIAKIHEKYRKHGKDAGGDEGQYALQKQEEKFHPIHQSTSATSASMVFLSVAPAIP